MPSTRIVQPTERVRRIDKRFSGRRSGLPLRGNSLAIARRLAALVAAFGPSSLKFFSR